MLGGRAPRHDSDAATRTNRRQDPAGTSSPRGLVLACAGLLHHGDVGAARRPPSCPTPPTVLGSGRWTCGPQSSGARGPAGGKAREEEEERGG
ncbi:hypothetical protein PAHAL_6G295100 [Panicum hallii]|uniref:Uncharacterized protein n=1 Tax=Panicum hallii TaxID=206008 RepID=A0A2T8II49_9POAL|nr:hypothetical protein PAHAL_6G295100 [Panicum hallii]